MTEHGVDERLEALMERRRALPDLSARRQLDVRVDDAPISMAEHVHDDIRELEYMTAIIGVCWDGELDDRSSEWLPYLAEKADRATRAGASIARIATQVAIGSRPEDAPPPSFEFSIATEAQAAAGIEIPFARREQHRAIPLRCPFCGADKLSVSWHDRDDDNGRMQLYCDNPLCDAREFEVIIRRDGQPGKRADIHALDTLASADIKPDSRMD